MWLLMLLPMLTAARQNDKGIRFEEGLTWEQVKTKASTENKLIFVDCYATWCKPCKIMDQTVYPNDTIGSYLNDRFISVKVQMDSSKGDNEQIKILYPAARLFEKEYNINALPTFLFFSPEGRALHKETGAKDIKEFMHLAADASNPDKQLYTLINKCREGTMPPEIMAALALKLKNEFRDNQTAAAIARDYKGKYLDKLSDEEFLTKKNLEFLESFSEIISPDDRIFYFFYRHPAHVDSLLGVKDHSKNWVNYIITKNMIDPSLIEANEKKKMPDWEHLEKKVSRKFGKYLAVRNITSAKLKWYTDKKDYQNQAKYLVREMDYIELSSLKNEIEGSVLNNRAWIIFLYSNDKQDLQKSLPWVDRALSLVKNITSKAEYMDTKANILYKLERREEALALETEVASFSKKKEHATNLEKMKKGEPTWIAIK